MASRFKKLLVKQIHSHCLNEIGFATKDQIAMQMKLAGLGRIIINSPLKIQKFTKTGKQLVECSVPVLPLLPDVIDKITVRNEDGKRALIFESNPQKVMKDILESDPKELSFQKAKKHIVIEHSSPNVSQPFHYGHLRSMLIGNSLANIKEKLGEKPIRLNFLGDWGAQFGLLKLGLELEGFPEESLKENPLELLFQAYVRGNNEAENNPEKVSVNSNDQSSVELRNKIQEWIVNHLRKSYERIGVNFNEYHWESSYDNKDSDAINKFKENDLLVTDEKERICAKVKDKLIPLMKNDGSTLYLARDLNAAFDRWSKFKFHEMYYVVEDKQNDHFQKLLALWEASDLELTENIHHVSFAKIQGLTTESNSVDFINSVFEEAKNLFLSKKDENIVKKTATDEKTADILGKSAIIIRILKKKRQIPCEFDWPSAFRFKGDTGVRVQYVHALLHNLLINHNDKIAPECNPKYLQETVVSNLVFLMSKYEEKLLESDMKFDPSVLVNYLIKLTHMSNEAYESLKVKNVDDNIAGQRLLLFRCSKGILEDGLRLLGLEPLEKL